LLIGILNPITATLIRTIRAAFGVRLVAVSLRPVVAVFFKAIANPVTTASTQAIVPAIIVFVAVAVIALLDPALAKAVAAGRIATKDRACISGVVVAVVALLNAGTNDTVPTACFTACVGASVLSHLVAIVAFFNTDMNQTIATTRRTASAWTGIKIILITIITSFPRVAHAITTAGPTAIGAAGIVGLIPVVVAIIALLETWANNAVAAARYRAIIQTRVPVGIVAVITGFIPLNHTIPAAPFTTLGRAAITIF
jgi:hypothetical protein